LKGLWLQIAVGVLVELNVGIGLTVKKIVSTFVQELIVIETTYLATILAVPEFVNVSLINAVALDPEIGFNPVVFLDQENVAPRVELLIVSL
jgi:hypothetical protein